MKTSTAMLSHSLVGIAQAGVMTQSLGANPNIPWWGQLIIQIVLLVGQVLLAQQNSNSMPDGSPIPPTVPKQ